MNRRMAVIAFIAVGLVTAFLAGCATTNQLVPAATGPIPANSARIIVSRGGGFVGAAAPIGIIDSGKQIGAVGLNDQISWDRIAGSMELVGFNTLSPPSFERAQPLRVCVGAGKTYQFKASWPTFSSKWFPDIELVSGTPVTCQQTGTASTVKVEQVQQFSAPTTAATAAPITPKAPEVLQTFTGEVKIIEVKHFTQAEGVGLSKEFMNYFYDGLRERLIKMQAAGQIIEEGAAVPDVLAANTIIVEGKITEYKQGGFFEGIGIVSSEIKLYRRSDHALIKTFNFRAPFKPSPLNTDKNIGPWTGARTADEIKKTLK